MGADGAERVRLGLIGGNIRASRSPDLHRICGQMTGLRVSYDLLIPAELGEDFETVLANCRRSGMRGVNVTYPYKERVTRLVGIPDPQVARLGAVNTVLFGREGMEGYNTDYSGFMAAYRTHFGDEPPGAVAIVGSGGVGRAIAFALLTLGADEVRLIDQDPEKSAALADALAGAGAPARIRVPDGLQPGLADATGVVNCTPLGMDGNPGSAVPARLLGGQRWAFDAVYTPVETEFKQQAEAAGLDVLSGYELFFHQGIQAFELFTGRKPGDLAFLRRRLNEDAQQATGDSR